MELIKFLMSLIAGAVIGWFASRMVKVEQELTHKPLPGEDPNSDES
jgi:uncharacterized protein YneF (UPF0154 family)